MIDKKSGKELTDNDKIVSSLINLRDELYLKQDYAVEYREVIYKINSCLFSKYPRSYEEN